MLVSVQRVLCIKDFAVTGHFLSFESHKMGSMSDTTHRTLRLLTLLRSRAEWTGSELAEQLETTTRSVRRDINRLRSLGYPVDSVRGHGGGYRLGTDAKLPPLILDLDQAVAVGVGLRLASSSGISGLDQQAEACLVKLEELSHAVLRERISTITQAVDVVSGSSTPVNADVLLALSHGIRGHLQVRMDYVARNGAPTHRRLEPYRVLAMGARWYLFAWDLDRGDWRTFRLDRIQAVRVSTFAFSPRPTPEIQEHLHRSVTTDPYQHVVRIRFRAPLAQVQGQLGTCAGLLQEDGAEACLFTTGSQDLQWTAGWLAGLALDMQIVEPMELVDAVADLGRQLLAIAQQSQGPHTQAVRSP